MTDSINNWYTAGGKLREIQAVSIAFQRGDQPEKIDHLTQDELKILTEVAFAIVDFCAASLALRPSPPQFRDIDTYALARSYARTLGYKLLRYEGLTVEDMVSVQKWLDREPQLPAVVDIFAY